MARATGSINYLEHRTPLKDESGKYQIHPMFVKRNTIDQEKMEKHVRDHCAMNVSSFISALETLEDETLYALAEGNEVRVGDMFIVKPKLGMVKHKDKNGIEWKRTSEQASFRVQAYTFSDIATRLSSSAEPSQQVCCLQSVHLLSLVTTPL